MLLQLLKEKSRGVSVTNYGLEFVERFPVLKSIRFLDLTLMLR